MKTFRLCSLTVYVEVNNQTAKHVIPLEDGLIINKENKEDHWLIEGIIKKDFFHFFNDLKEQKESMLIEASITNKDNPPATFVATVREIKFIQDELQLLLDGKRLIRKDTLSHIILKDLIKHGISGEDLLTEFKRMKKERGTAFEKMIDNELKQIKVKNVGKL